MNAAACGQSIREVKRVNWRQYGQIIDLEVFGQYIVMFDFVSHSDVSEVILRRFQVLKISTVYQIQPKNIEILFLRTCRTVGPYDFRDHGIAVGIAELAD